MQKPTDLVRRLAALACVAGIVAAHLATPRADERVAGGETFTSKRKWFTVRVPRTDSVSGRLFDVSDTYGRGDSTFEETAFFIRELGEIYHVGVRRVGPTLRLLVPGAPPGDLPPDSLSYIALALHYGARVPGPVTVDESVVLSARPGTGLMRVNRVENGSVLQGLAAASDSEAAALMRNAYPGRRSADALVVTGVVPLGAYMLYASAQNDYLGLDELGRERRVAVLKDRVQGLIDSFTLLRELPTK